MKTENQEKVLDRGILKNLKYDLPAGLVVFLVALPLCLGIALASGAPMFSGIVAGIVGGLIVPLISRSSLSVSGPAAGLTAIVLAGIENLGGFEVFILAVMLAGLMQVTMGFIKAGTIAYFFPTSVIRGMLAAIGIILIMKQIPHALGYDFDYTGDFNSLFTGAESAFEALSHAMGLFHTGAIIISVISIAILIIWDKTPLKKISILPSALVVVILGTIINQLFISFAPTLVIGSSHLVSLPPIDGLAGMAAQIVLPQFGAIGRLDVWLMALTIALVASIETLLSVEAVDQLDPFKRESRLNQELIAQGAGNFAAGLLGALPITAVIVRSSTNVAAGGRTRAAAFYHGLFLLFAVAYISTVLNMIPLASLAAILLMVGYKLASPALMKKVYAEGMNRFIPFAVTIVAILLTDLLIGIGIGMATGIFFVIRANFHSAVAVNKVDNKYIIKLRKDVSFLNKATLVQILNRLPENSHIVIDGSRSEFIDADVVEIIDRFKEKSKYKGIHLEVMNMNSQSFVKPQNKKDHAGVIRELVESKP